MALQKKNGAAVATAPAGNGVNFGDLGVYTSGGGLPEGNYALEFQTCMYQAKDQQGVAKGPSRLGVMITAHSLTDGKAEPREQFYSMGSKAAESFSPDPDTGKGLVPNAGGPGGSLNKSTNWAVFLEHLYSSGLPNGIFTNDLSVLDGVHVHMANIPEPEERKGFQSKLDEVEAEPRKNKTIAVITEILEGGAPWEGGGGIPVKGAPVNGSGRAPAKSAPAAKAASAPKAATAKPTPPPAQATELSEEDLMQAALEGAASVFEKNTDGCMTLVLRTGTYQHVNKAYGEEVGTAVIDTFFGNDDAINSVVGQLGYTVSGKKVVAASA